MKQELLFNAPKTRPSKAKKLSEFKSQHGILTHDSGRQPDGGIMRWVAVKVPPKRLDDGGPIKGMSLFDMCANFCRLLDEGGWTGYGNSELEAVRDVCKTRGICCDL